MLDDQGNLSIDFLAGMTIFMIALIWISTMAPGLLITLQSKTIDYDAVAYRTGAILVEDPGWPATPPWDNLNSLQKGDIQRFGLSLAKDYPNLLSLHKINQFFCSTIFSYPSDYQSRLTFSNYPYLFNISLSTFDRTINESIGDIKPDGYGYIRRYIKIKYPSNTTILAPNYRNSGVSGGTSDNTTTHVFSVQLNCTDLIWDQTNLAYQINPLNDQITVNVSNLSKASIFNNPNPVNLSSIKIYRQNPTQPLGQVTEYLSPGQQFNIYVDGSNIPIPALDPPSVGVNNNVSVIFSPGYFFGMASDSSQMYVNYTFTLTYPDNFFNNTFTTPYLYNYNPAQVTQPSLKEGVLEVAVW